MARDLFTETFTYVDPVSGSLKPMNNTQITVYLAGTNTKPTLYAARDTSNATQVNNPFVTGANGVAEFWVGPGEYDIAIHDLASPARAADKTVGFSAVPGGVGGIPGNRIAADNGLPYDAQDPESTRQDVPIGGVIDWWRPSSAVPLPTGWEPCDGSTITAENHEFPNITTSIILPDLRNKFILGASAEKSYGASAGSDGAANAPGIGGTGGAMTRDLAHVHDMSNHIHTIAHTHTFAHTHTLPHTHTLTHTHDLSNHVHAIGHNHVVTVPAHYHGVGTITASGGDHSHNVNDPGHGHGIGLFVNGGGNIGVSFVATGVNSRTTANDLASVYGSGTGIWISSSGHYHPTSNFSGHIGATGSGNNGDGSLSVTSGASSATNSGLPSNNSTGAASNSTTSAASTDVTATQSNSTTSASSAANSGAPSTNNSGSALTVIDVKPQYMGLLKLMKVRRV